MTRAHFRFATDILRRLGEELNPSLDQGVLELVKNAYDADAPSCTIELRDVDQPGGTLRIEDTGAGMPEDQIIDSFLVLGRSSKDPRARTPKGRIPAGSKGLGRLAALRSGDRVVLVTRPESEPKRQFRLEIDWREFERAAVVDQVELVIERQPRPRSRRAAPRSWSKGCATRSAGVRCSGWPDHCSCLSIPSEVWRARSPPSSSPPSSPTWRSSSARSTSTWLSTT